MHPSLHEPFSCTCQRRFIWRAALSLSLLWLLAAPVLASTVFDNGFEGPGLRAIPDHGVFALNPLVIDTAQYVDAPPEGLNYALPTAPAGMSIDASNGRIDWLPGMERLGTHPVVLRVGTSANAFNYAAFRVEVLDPTNRPRLVPVDDQQVTQGDALVLQLVAIDPDPGEMLTFSKHDGPAGLSIAADGTLHWPTTAQDVPGRYPVQAVVVDSLGLADRIRFDVDLLRTNTAPTYAAQPERQTTPGTLLQATITAFDPDPDETLRYTLVQAPPGTTYGASDGVFAFTPQADQLGLHRIVLRATDSREAMDEARFDLRVSEEPVLIAVDDSYRVVVGETLVVTTPGVLDNDMEANGNPLLAELLQGPERGTLNFNPDGSFSYTPDPLPQKRADDGNELTLFFTDFNGGLPSQITTCTSTPQGGDWQITGVQGFAGLGPEGNQFNGNLLRAAAQCTLELTLHNLPPHTALDIGFLFAAIDSLDGAGTFPAGDWFEVRMDGQLLFREAFANATSGQIQTYEAPSGVTLARRQHLGFDSGLYHFDSAYNLSADPVFRNVPHQADSVTISFRFDAIPQGMDDESIGIDNLRVSIALPPGQVASDRFSYQAGNGSQTSEPAQVRIGIAEPNAPPRFLSNPASSAAIDLPWRYDALAVGSQPGVVITYSLLLAPAGAGIDPVSGTILWTPAHNQLGNRRFIVQAHDPRDETTLQTFNVFVDFQRTVPDLIGSALGDSETQLQSANLLLGSVSMRYDETMDAGLVLTQSVQAGTPVAAMTVVHVEVSLGPAPPQPQSLPTVVGLPLADAEQVLLDAGFSLGAVLAVNDQALPPGTVAAQVPAAAQYLPQGTAVSLHVVSGPSLRFDPGRDFLDAGEPLTLTASAYDAAGEEEAGAGIVYGVEPVAGLSSGTPLQVNGDLLSSAADSRGRYRLWAQRADSGVTVETFITVVAPTPPDPEHAARDRFRALLATLPDTYRRLLAAVEANDPAALAALRTELADSADQLQADMDLLRRTPMVAPEKGFFPDAGVLAAAGFPETEADRQWQAHLTSGNVLLELIGDELDTLTAASSASDFTFLTYLDSQLGLRLQRMEALTPGIHAAVTSAHATQAMLAVRMPGMVLSELRSMERLLDGDGKTARPKFIGALVAGTSGAVFRNAVYEKLYKRAYQHVIHSGIVMALNQLLREFYGDYGSFDVVTGSSLAIHVFSVPGSRLEGAFTPQPEVHNVVMIGPDYVDTALGLFDMFDLRNVDSAKKITQKLNELARGASDVLGAIDDANSVPDFAQQVCYFSEDDCVALIYENGFKTVNQGAMLNLPGPVLIIVHDTATGRVHVGLFGFLPHPGDPSFP